MAEHYMLMKIVHAVLAVLLTAGVVAHSLMLIKAVRGGDTQVVAHKVRVTWCFSFPTLALCAILLVVSGGLLVRTAGWPLGQAWLFYSSILMLVLLVLVALLGICLQRWHGLAGQASARLKYFSASYAGLIVLVLLVVFALMGAKPQ